MREPVDISPAPEDHLAISARLLAVKVDAAFEDRFRPAANENEMRESLGRWVGSGAALEALPRHPRDMVAKLEGGFNAV